MSAKPILEIESLSKSFGGLIAVNKVSLDVSRGETVGLIGPNGAGKTTLFNLITGFIRPDSGRIKFDIHDITHASTAKIVNTGIARTFQIVRPFANIPVYENVLIPALSPHARKSSTDSPETAVKQALEKVELWSKAHSNAAQLTHGEQKRLELARAIATKPNLLMLDEPFSGLGSDEVGPISSLITELKKYGITIIVIEHRLKELMRFATRVVAMNEGAIVADGEPKQVVNDAKVIESYLGKGVSFA